MFFDARIDGRIPYPPRPRLIGWSKDQRRRNLRFLAYNLRFLILPWVEVPHLASHILGRMARILPEDWERIYGHRVVFLVSAAV